MNASELRLYSRLQRAAHQAKRAADKALLDVAAITTAQAAVLIVVADGHAVSQKEAADQLGLKEPAVASMVARLVKLGYMTRRRSRQDARAWELAVTEAGASALRAGAAPFAKINSVIEDAVGAKDIDAFAEQLAALAERFERT